jgi:hypothetical protein
MPVVYFQKQKEREMFRFRIWDTKEQEYLENLDSFSMDSDGNIKWYDGTYLNGEYVPGSGSVQAPCSEGRYEVEFGNGYCFHNDIVQATKFGGCFDIESPLYSENIPKDAVNISIDKKFSLFTAYWDIPIYGVAIMQREVMEMEIAGITCKDAFYGYDGCVFSWSDIKVVGNYRLDTPEFCRHRAEMYNNYIKRSILPKEIINETDEAR